LIRAREIPEPERRLPSGRRDGGGHPRPLDLVPHLAEDAEPGERPRLESEGRAHEEREEEAEDEPSGRPRDRARGGFVRAGHRGRYLGTRNRAAPGSETGPVRRRRWTGRSEPAVGRTTRTVPTWFR